jgi:hypothetical protein
MNEMEVCGSARVEGTDSAATLRQRNDEGLCNLCTNAATRKLAPEPQRSPRTGIADPDLAGILRQRHEKCFQERAALSSRAEGELGLPRPTESAAGGGQSVQQVQLIRGADSDLATILQRRREAFTAESEEHS